MKNNFLKILSIVFAFALFTTACEDLNVEDKGLDTDAVQDNALTERAISDIFTTIKNGTSLAKKESNCPIITFEVASKFLTLNYGETGCVGPDGIKRSGIITATFSNYDGWVDGTTAVVSFDNFKVNDHPLTGVMTITSELTNDVLNFNVNATEMVLTFEDETNITWNASTVMSYVKMDNTGTYWKINGEASGISRKGNNFSRTSENLLTDPSCKWFVGGTLTLSTANTTDVITFTECGKISVKHNNLPAIEINLN